MATRHPRLTVFSGAFASLLVMSILSAGLGKVVLGLIPAVSVLRVYEGGRMGVGGGGREVRERGG